MIKKFILLLVFVNFLMVPSLVFGHGLGQSFQQVVGEYLVEFEYETFESLADEATPYVFRLQNNETGEPTAFESLLVRIVSEDTNETTAVARLEEDDFLTGVSRLTVLLPEGDYAVDMNFKNTEGDTFVEAEFEHTVLPAEGFDWIPVVSAIVGLIVGAGGLKLVEGFLSKKNGSKGKTK